MHEHDTTSTHPQHVVKNVADPLLLQFRGESKPKTAPRPYATLQYRIDVSGRGGSYNVPKRHYSNLGDDAGLKRTETDPLRRGRRVVMALHQVEHVLKRDKSLRSLRRKRDGELFLYEAHQNDRTEGVPRRNGVDRCTPHGRRRNARKCQLKTLC